MVWATSYAATDTDLYGVDQAMAPMTATQSSTNFEPVGGMNLVTGEEIESPPKPSPGRFNLD